MSHKSQIPLYRFCTIHEGVSAGADISVSSLDRFIQEHPNLIFPHKHNFFQLLLIVHGAGRHVIDFKSYPCDAGLLYLLAPGQVHDWQFEKGTDGILVNFDENIFGSILSCPNFLDRYSFFIGNGAHSFWNTGKGFSFFKAKFSAMLSEFEQKECFNTDMILTYLFQIFIFLQRQQSEATDRTGINRYSHRIFRNFELLVEKNYSEIRLPKEYAFKLFITPNYLNAICKEVMGISAGEIIRNRVLLEAKRLLANSTLTVGEIAVQLHFETNSYFTRFFKKYEMTTPDQFRKMNMVQNK